MAVAVSMRSWSARIKSWRFSPAAMGGRNCKTIRPRFFKNPAGPVQKSPEFNATGTQVTSSR